MGDIHKLLEIMSRLRDPDSGCPWDLEQDFRSIAPYTIEEAYEVADAIERGDMGGLQDELGDLLFQVVYHAQMADEQGTFDFAGVAASICDKMIRRHPHVFGDAEVTDADSQTRAWESHKQNERGDKGDHGVLAGVTRGLPALRRAVKLGKRASRVGFDWQDRQGPRDKVDEELREIDRELSESQDPRRLEEEVGDLLFAISNLCRHIDVDPEAALRRANGKFERRFRFIEERLAERDLEPRDADLELMDGLWNEAKEQGL